MEQHFVFRECGLGQLDLILDLEREVVESLVRPDLLRRNTLEMWRSCLLPPHFCLGAWAGEALVALAVLYVPQEGDGEDLSALLQHRPVGPAANYKICIVRPAFRGQGLMQRLGRCLEAEARHRGIGMLCTTVSPYNEASAKNVLRLGYRYDHTLVKYGFERDLYCKVL